MQHCTCLLFSLQAPEHALDLVLAQFADTSKAYAASRINKMRCGYRSDCIFLRNAALRVKRNRVVHAVTGCKLTYSLKTTFSDKLVIEPINAGDYQPFAVSCLYTACKSGVSSRHGTLHVAQKLSSTTLPV